MVTHGVRLGGMGLIVQLLGLVLIVAGVALTVGPGVAVGCAGGVLLWVGHRLAVDDESDG